MRETRRPLFMVFGAILAGCLLPTEEAEQDGGLPLNMDAGLETAPDAGPRRVDCFAPANTMSLAVSELPDGCTHFKGSLFLVGRAVPQIADAEAGKVANLAEVDGRISFENVFPSENVRGFARLQRVSGALDFRAGTLRSISAASRLKEVGSLSFLLISGLEDIGLPSLEVVHGDLFIADNSDLRTLSGLASLRVIEGKFSYGGNPKLRPVEVDAFVRRVAIDGGVVRQ
jgi:hypothetical protein